MKARARPDWKERERARTERNKEQKKKYDKEHFWEIKESHLKRLYGITVIEYNELFKKHNGVCGICFKPETRKGRVSGNVMKLVVDHNHDTMKVRGLLCNGCNIALGKFNDNPVLLKSAFDYLIKHKP